MDDVVANWAGLAVALVLGACGVVAKRLIPAHSWVRKTLPLHPVLAGMAIGLLPLPVPSGVDGLAGRCLYFAGAGVVSAWVYDAVRPWIRARFGLEERRRNP